MQKSPFLGSLLALLVAVPALADGLSAPLPVPQIGQARAAMKFPPQALGGGYQGPGDIVGFTSWYSCSRAFNASFASPGNSKACKVRRALDNVACDFDITTAGTLGNSDAGCSSHTNLSLTAFATTDATGSGTISGTTLTLSGASSTPHTGSSLTGAGIVQPSYIVSCGTFTGGAGTCTLNQAQTVSSSETITLTYALYITEAYDQTGNGNHLIQGSTAAQPQLIPNCFGANPCVTTNTSTQSLPSAANVTPATGVVSFQGVAMRDNVAHTGTLISENGASGNSFGTNNVANAWRLVGGSSGTFNVTVSNAVAHAFSAVENGASSVVNIDGTETTGTATGSTTAGAVIGFAGTSSQNTTYGEIGFLDNALIGPTTRTALCHNSYLFWTTAQSC